MPDEPLRLMAVHAHPGDESSKGAGTMARYVSESGDVLGVTCTGGGAGSILNPGMGGREIEATPTEVGGGEMEEAGRILGVRRGWLGFLDSGSPGGGPPPPLPDDCFGVLPID